ncbi:hypothetical protein XHV734_2355 [Xanthomonas hortorum pv. vitians]|nr:hypothetical protein XHV734_2355 [Xanthomonas hortorum pv. vitians]
MLRLSDCCTPVQINIENATIFLTFRFALFYRILLGISFLQFTSRHAKIFISITRNGSPSFYPFSAWARRLLNCVSLRNRSTCNRPLTTNLILPWRTTLCPGATREE